MTDMRSLKTISGPGIATVGYLTVALSAALIVVALKVGQFTEQPRWTYFVPVLLGLTGAIAGFLVGAGGIVITWASFGNRQVNLDWLIAKVTCLQRWRPVVFFGWSAACALALAIFGLFDYMGMNSGLPFLGTIFLISTSLFYLGIVSKLWRFLSSELARSA
jgi:hypothetical protein